MQGFKKSRLDYLAILFKLWVRLHINFEENYNVNILLVNTRVKFNSTLFRIWIRDKNL
jgi:hypothetical protein